MKLVLRPMTRDDFEPCGRILGEAFTQIQLRHGFPPVFPTPEAAIWFIQIPATNPSIYNVVAELDGRIVGSNFLEERDPIRAIGPISVSPSVQGKGVGKRLMDDVMRRARGAPGIRLVQETFNMASLSLYAKLGFDAVEPLLLLEGTPASAPMRGFEVRPLTDKDLPACEALCKRVHGFTRNGELSDALRTLTPFVVVRGGRVTAYCTTLRVWGLTHAVAQDEDDMRALILGVAAAEPQPFLGRPAAEGRTLRFVMPIRQASLFRWCLNERFRAIKPLTLMVTGEYQEPRGFWLPSVSY